MSLSGGRWPARARPTAWSPPRRDRAAARLGRGSVSCSMKTTPARFSARRLRSSVSCFGSVSPRSNCSTAEAEPRIAGYEIGPGMGARAVSLRTCAGLYRRAVVRLLASPLQMGGNCSQHLFWRHVAALLDEYSIERLELGP